MLSDRKRYNGQQQVLQFQVNNIDTDRLHSLSQLLGREVCNVRHFQSECGKIVSVSLYLTNQKTRVVHEFSTTNLVDKTILDQLFSQEIGCLSCVKMSKEKKVSNYSHSSWYTPLFMLGQFTVTNVIHVFISSQTTIETNKVGKEQLACNVRLKSIPFQFSRVNSVSIIYYDN